MYNKLIYLIFVVLLLLVIVSLVFIPRNIIETDIRVEPLRISWIDKEYKVPWEFSGPWREYLNTLALGQPNENVLNDDHYCKKVHDYQKEVQIEKNKLGLPNKEYRFVFSDYSNELYVKQMLRENGMISNPDLVGKKDFTGLPPEALDPRISIFFHLKPAWHQFHQIGRHFLCQNQRYNHIPGNLYLNFKDIVTNSMIKYSKHFKGREKCFSPWEIMPETYDLVDKAQCTTFMKILKTQKLSDINWIVKISRYSHNGEGLQLVTSVNAENFTSTFGSCPSNTKKIAQKYITQPFLIDSKKFDFRAYLVIASMDPLIVLYHDGYIKLSVEKYNLTSDDLAVHLTNTNIAKNKAKEMGMEDEIMQEQSWNFNKFNHYMKEKHNVDDKWIENIRKEIKRVMMHMIAMNIDKLSRHPQVFEMFGFDFILDSDMKLWYLETNLSPSIAATSDDKKAVNEKMFTKLIDIQYALIYNISIDTIIETSDFHWIYDGRKTGLDKFCGSIEPECIA